LKKGFEEVNMAMCIIHIFVSRHKCNLNQWSAIKIAIFYSVVNYQFLRICLVARGFFIHLQLAVSI